jgi:hypothetical protein
MSRTDCASLPRGPLPPGLVRPAAAAMVHVLAQHQDQVALAGDQCLVHQLTAKDPMTRSSEDGRGTTSGGNLSLALCSGIPADSRRAGPGGVVHLVVVPDGLHVGPVLVSASGALRSRWLLSFYASSGELGIFTQQWSAR